MSRNEEISVFSSLILHPELSVKEIFSERTSLNISVYRNNYFFGKLNLLKNCYQVTLMALGEKNFRFFSREYIQSTHSSSSNADDYGRCFYQFLAKRDELTRTPHFAYLAAIDRLWFDLDCHRQLNLPRGMLALWNQILNKSEVIQIEINENILGVIRIEFLQNSQYYLVES